MGSRISRNTVRISDAEEFQKDKGFCKEQVCKSSTKPKGLGKLEEVDWQNDVQGREWESKDNAKERGLWDERA